MERPRRLLYGELLCGRNQSRQKKRYKAYTLFQSKTDPHWRKIKSREVDLFFAALACQISENFEEHRCQNMNIQRKHHPRTFLALVTIPNF